jgi:hypothetical protein
MALETGAERQLRITGQHGLQDLIRVLADGFAEPV